MLGQCDWTSSKPSFERLDYRRFALLTSGYVSLGGFTALGKSPDRSITSDYKSEFSITLDCKSSVTGGAYCFCNVSGASPLPVTYRQSVPALVNATFMAFMASVQSPLVTLVVPPLLVWSSPMPLL